MRSFGLESALGWEALALVGMYVGIQLGGLENLYWRR